ncbi:MAG: hypothetical protein PHT71_04700, partial [Victivallaceae bacterium]|nr:hypothetical protein [Victivallaceae bacterium]
ILTTSRIRRKPVFKFFHRFWVIFHEDIIYTLWLVVSSGYPINIMLNAARTNYYTEINRPGMIHSGGTNILFVDGHVEFYKSSEIDPEKLFKPIK